MTDRLVLRMQSITPPKTLYLVVRLVAYDPDKLITLRAVLTMMQKHTGGE